MLQAFLGGLGSNYIRGAMLAYSGVSGGLKQAGVQGNFNSLYVQMLRDTKAGVELKDLKHLEATLRQVAPEMFRDFQRNLTRVGRPAVNEMRKTFRSIGERGPVWKQRPGRFYDSMYSSYVSNISWYQTKFATGRRGIDVNYKNRKRGADLTRLRNGSDGTLGIVRIAVKSPAFIMADITGRGNKRQATGSLSREYRIHAFGQSPYVMRRHKVNAENVQKWISALNNGKSRLSGKPSRYAYPTLEKHSPAFAKNVTGVLNSTITELNRRLAA